jgi:hypothetical protein
MRQSHKREAVDHKPSLWEEKMVRGKKLLYNRHVTWAEIIQKWEDALSSNLIWTVQSFAEDL